MTPAEELRAFANLLRDTAAKATTGPWNVADGTTVGVGIETHSRGHYSYDLIVAEVTEQGERENDVWARGPRGESLKAGTPEADAAWIALANPSLAEPLAVLIDDIADFAGEVTTEPPPDHIVGKALANLCWGTHTENMHDKARHGTEMFGEAKPDARLTEDQVRAIRIDPRPSRVVGRDYGVSHTAVLRIRRGERWKRVA